MHMCMEHFQLGMGLTRQLQYPILLQTLKSEKKYKGGEICNMQTAITVGE